MYYASFGILALIIHFIINFNIIKINKSKASPLHYRYKCFLNTVVIYYVTDIIWGFLSDLKNLPLVYADTVIYFIAMVLSVLFWTRYVAAYLRIHNRFNKILMCSGWIIFGFEAILLIVNFFYPVAFYFDSDVNYHAKVGRYCTLGILMLLYLLTSCHTLIYAIKSEGIERFHHRTIGFSGLLMILFIVLQAMYPLLPFYAIGCLLTTCLVHSFIMEERLNNSDKALDSAKQIALTDSLTGIKNTYAYTESIKKIEQRIKDNELSVFGIIVFDLNGLKQINDTQGHEAGNKYIKDACSIICNQFKHSPVYRIGGDEFVAFLEGIDYENRYILLRDFEKQIDENLREGLIVISDGFSEYVPGDDYFYQTIFERADRKMYERKKYLKEKK